MRKVLVVTAMLAAVLMLVPASQAVTLASLLAGGSITVGDKVFDDFTCNVGTATGATGSDCTNASVVGIGAGTSEEGIRFGGFFFAAGDGAAGALMDITITYDVATTGPNRIEDVNMAFNATNPVPNAQVAVDEKVCSGDVSSLCSSPIADISVMRSHIGASSIVQLSDHADFSSLQSSVSVFKDIGLFADKHGDVSFSILDQTFSQTTVPEPASITLLGTVLFGFGAILRRRRKGNA